MDIKTVAVTGASGFVGQHLLKLLSHSKRYKALGLSRGEIGLKKTNWRQVDYLDSSSVEESLTGCHQVVHLAGLAHKKLADATYETYEKAIVDTTVQLLNAAKTCGIERFVYASSISVYGEENLGVIDEDSPCHPQCYYGQAKLAAERIVEEFCEANGLDYQIIRLPPLYGPGMRGSVRWLFKAASWHLPLPLWGHRSRRCFLYVNNAALFFEAALDGKLASGTYLPHEGVVTTAQVYADIYQACHNKPLPILARVWLPRLVHNLLAKLPGLRPLYANLAFASKHHRRFEELGFVSSQQGLQRTARDMHQH